MRISFIGKGSETLLDDLKNAGIEFEHQPPTPRGVMNAMSWIEIVESADRLKPWGSIAVVLCAWFTARASRKVILTRKDNSVIQIQGMSAADVEKILPACKSAVATEAKEPNSQDTQDTPHKK